MDQYQIIEKIISYVAENMDKDLCLETLSRNFIILSIIFRGSFLKIPDIPYTSILNNSALIEPQRN